MKTYIYKLLDENKQPRYIGKSNNPQSRLRKHIYLTINNIDRTHKEKWIKSMLDKGLRPTIEIIEEVDIEFWQDREIYWMQKYIEDGYKLTNGTKGGDKEIKFTEEVRKKMSESRKKYTQSTETRQKAADSCRGKKRTKEQCDNIGRGNKGVSKPKSKEFREKVSKTMSGKKQTEEHRLNRISKGFGEKKTIVFYYDTGLLVGKYNSLKDACEELKINISCAGRVARGERKKTKNYIFIYE